MTPRYTRRDVFKGVTAAAVTFSIGAGTLLAIKRSFTELEAEKICLDLYAQINKAGWKGARPVIFSVKGQPNTYVTGPLPVVGGCNVTLIFSGNDGKSYRVRHYTTINAEEYIMAVTGQDKKQYPDALIELQNPTKQQLDQMLTAAGLTKCNPLSR